MKFIFLTVCLLLFSPLLHSQGEQLPNINNLTPKWYHLLQDTNFQVDSIAYIVKTKYNVCRYRKFVKIGNNMLIHNECFTGIGDKNGNIFQYLDVLTGKMHWTRAINNDNFLVHQEIYQDMFYDPFEDVITLKGFRKNGKPLDTWTPWVFEQQSLVATMQLDAKSGNILNHSANENVGDTIPWRPNTKLFYNSSKDRYWFVEEERFDSELRYLAREIGEDNQFVSEIRSLAIQPTNFDFILGSSYFSDILGTDATNHIYGNRFVVNHELEYPNIFHLHKTVIRDLPDGNSIFDTIYVKDLSKYVRHSYDAYRSFEYHIHDEGIILTITYFDSTDNGNLKRSFLDIDQNGHINQYIHSLPFVEGKPSTIWFLGKKNGTTYFVVTQTSSSQKLCSVDINGNFKEITTMDYHQGDESETSIPYAGLINDNNEVVFIIQVANGKYYYTACYNAKDLGLDFTSSIDQTPTVSFPFLISPNPVTDFVSIKSLSNITSDKKVLIFDSFGRNIKSINMEDEYLYIPIEGLTPGLYSVAILSSDGSIAYQRKIVKM